MTHQELYKRIYDFSIRVERFAAPLFDRPATADIADQLTRSARGAAANYQASNHGRTNTEFRSKLAVALEEADETQHWLQDLVDSGRASGPTVLSLLKESREICKILWASQRTANRNARARGADHFRGSSGRRTDRTRRPRPCESRSGKPQPDEDDNLVG